MRTCGERHYRKAGHCVAGILYGRSIRYVTIISTKRKNAQGHIMAGRTSFRRPKAAQSTEESKAEVNAALMVCYAGLVCESRSGKAVDLSSSSLTA
jgi:hypothetical protein